MIAVEVEEGLSLHFAGRSIEFAQGVEIGLLAADLAAGRDYVVRLMSEGSIEQAEKLIAGFGYRVLARRSDNGRVELSCTNQAFRPRLSIVR